MSTKAKKSGDRLYWHRTRGAESLWTERLEGQSAPAWGALWSSARNQVAVGDAGACAAGYDVTGNIR